MSIDKEKLKDLIPAIAAEHKFRPAVVEKDYYLTIILNDIGALLSDKIIFKGGTLLNKVHLNYHRLSEDLDFTYFGKEDLTTRSKRSAAIAPIKATMPGFIEHLGLRSEKPKGEGFNSSTQYVFKILYPSIITGKEALIKIEISLRQKPIEAPVSNTIHHFYKDPFTGDKLLPENKILCLTLNEAVAEKMKAAITRKDPAIRDFFDLWHIAGSGFDFHAKRFLDIFKKKLEYEGYKGDFRHNFGLKKDDIDSLVRQIETDLIPVIRTDESFEIEKVFKRFDKIFSAYSA